MFASVSAFFLASHVSSPMQIDGKETGVGVLTSAQAASNSIGKSRIITSSSKQQRAARLLSLSQQS